MPQDSIVFKAKSQKLTAFSRTRNTNRLSLCVIIYDPHSIPIGQSKEKNKARDENRQEGEQTAKEIAFHFIQVYRISPITKTTLLRWWFLSVKLLSLLREKLGS